MICCPRQESEIQNLPGQHIFFSAACFFPSVIFLCIFIVFSANSNIRVCLMKHIH